MISATPRRVVTGLDKDGRSAILIDDRGDTVLWRTDNLPVDNDGPRGDDVRHAAKANYAPAPGATHFLFSEMPPGKELFGPGMHATDTIDYVVVMKGAITIVTETGETELLAGDTLVDRGVIHGWRNDGSESAIIAVVMIAAHPLEAGSGGNGAVGGATA